MKREQDHYGIKAKKMGYPARSVFKLQEIMEKFPLVPKNASVLDVGAAPGSFSQFLLEKMKGGGTVVGVDLAASVQVPDKYSNFIYISGDIYDDKIQTRLFELGPYDVVISDAAPATSGQRELDTLKSISLAEAVFAVAEKTLKPNGNFLVKIFQGGGEVDYMNMLRAHFGKVKGFKPQASRKESFETFFIGLGFTG